MVGVNVLRDDLQDVIDPATHRPAISNPLHRRDGPFEAVEIGLPVVGQCDLDQHRCQGDDAARGKAGMVARDDACLFQLAQAQPAGGRRKTGNLGQLQLGDATVLPHGSKNTQINRIQFHRSPVLPVCAQ